MTIKLDCRQGWEVDKFRVAGWRPNAVVTELHGQEPNEKLTKQVAEKLPADQLVILDIEHWALPQEIDKHIQVVDWIREVRPELRIGFYGILPLLAYWPSIVGGKTLSQWKQFNAALGRTRDAKGRYSVRGLVDVVDFICPCLYSFYPSGGGWDHESLWFSHYAPATIEAAREYQKQIYPFVWQRISDEAGKLDQLLPDDHFKRQIQYCIDNADGVCIWDWADEKTGTDVLKTTSEIMKEFTQ